MLRLTMLSAATVAGVFAACSCPGGGDGSMYANLETTLPLTVGSPSIQQDGWAAISMSTSQFALVVEPLGGASTFGSYGVGNGDGTYNITSWDPSTCTNARSALPVMPNACVGDGHLYSQLVGSQWVFGGFFVVQYADPNNQIMTVEPTTCFPMNLRGMIGTQATRQFTTFNFYNNSASDVPTLFESLPPSRCL